MEAFLLYLLLIIIIDVCSARIPYTGSSYSSLTSSQTTAIIVSIVGGTFLIFLCIFCIVKNYARKQRMGVLPLSTQRALAQQENQYTPPSYYQTPPYGQPPPYEQLPPPYFAANASIEPTKMTFTS
jgi:hypothetical protein